METFVEHLVVDSGGFIKLVNLENLANKIYTLHEVIDEIRDKKTRERLQILPYEINYLSPLCEDLKFVTEFSKKTGDYTSLSATDLKVLAATLYLEKLYEGVGHLKLQPTITKTPNPNPEEKTEKSNEIILPLGFYKPQNIQKLEEKLEKLEIEESDESNDDEASWITPNSLAQSKKAVTVEKITAACLTGDFSIQNVALHIGLKVLSPNGSIIHRLNTYILRCTSCYKTTSIMTKQFCPECGNQTLKRVAVTVNEDGSQKLHISKRPLNIRGLNKPPPTFKGGKHANNPIICADQPMPDNKLSKKALQKLNVLDQEYTARESPFLDRDVYSRSALLGIRKLTGKSDKRKR